MVDPGPFLRRLSLERRFVPYIFLFPGPHSVRRTQALQRWVLQTLPNEMRWILTTPTAEPLLKPLPLLSFCRAGTWHASCNVDHEIIWRRFFYALHASSSDRFLLPHGAGSI